LAKISEKKTGKFAPKVKDKGGFLNLALHVHFFRQKVFIYAAVICFFFHVFTNAAWTDAPVPERQVTIVEAVQKALSDNHEIKAMKSSSYAKEQDIGIARSYLLPKISVEGRYLRTNNPGYAFMSGLIRSGSRHRISIPRH
jgi:hypothetical protein